MKKRIILRLLLVSAVSLFLICGAAAQEEADTGRGDTTSEKSDESTPATDGTAAHEDTANRDTAATKKEQARKTERRKKEVRRQQEKKEAEAEETDVDNENAEGLLLVDHEKIKYNRIPGITLPADESEGDRIVKVPNDKKARSESKDDEKGGIFGKNTGAIAGWGLLIIIFIIFVIYSKTRGRSSRRRVVRTMPKR